MHSYVTTGVSIPSSSYGSYQYDQQGQAVWMAYPPLTAADVPVMLGTPFTTVASLAAKIAAEVPTGLPVWITEYNLLFNAATHPDVTAFGTWAHGLFVALETVLYLQQSSITSGRVTKHCLYGLAYAGALFQNEKSFDFEMSPDASLATTPYHPSATGLIAGLIGNVTGGMASVTALNVSSAARIVIDPETNYPSVVGVHLTGGGTSSGIIINLANESVRVGVGDTFRSFRQLSVADATTAINNVQQQVTTNTGPVTHELLLDAYSVTALFG